MWIVSNGFLQKQREQKKWPNCPRNIRAHPGLRNAHPLPRPRTPKRRSAPIARWRPPRVQVSNIYPHHKYCDTAGNQTECVNFTFRSIVPRRVCRGSKQVTHTIVKKSGHPTVNSVRTVIPSLWSRFIINKASLIHIVISVYFICYFDK